MSEKCGIFKLTNDNGLGLLVNDFDLPGYQTHLNPAHKIMDFTTEAMEGLLNRIIPMIVANHMESNQLLNSSTFNSTQMIVLNANDLTLIQTQINTSLIYYSTIPSTPKPNSWSVQRYLDSTSLNKVWTLFANNPTMKFVYRKYNPVSYTTSDYSALANDVTDYIKLDTSVISSSDKIPSNSNISTLGQSIKKRLSSYSKMTNVDSEQDSSGYFVYGTLPANSTAKTIPKITFIARLDTTESYPGAPSPVLTYNFDKLYNDLKIDVASKAYTSDEYSQWLASGIIVASDPLTNLGIKSKAGIVEIFRMLDILTTTPSTLHGDINILFISDSELNKAFKNVTTSSKVYKKILKNSHICFWVDGEGTGIVNINSYIIASMKFVFTGDGETTNALVDAARLAVYLNQSSKNTETVIMSYISKSDWVVATDTTKYDPVFDPETGFSPITDIAERQQAIRNKYIDETISLTNTVDLSGYNVNNTIVDLTKDIEIKSLGGDKYTAELVVEVTDLELSWLNKKISMIKTLLSILEQRNFIKSNVVTTETSIQTDFGKILPTTMKSLASEAIVETYGRSLISRPILDAKNILDLSTIVNGLGKQIPSIVISSGGYNYNTNREFLPVYNLEMCAKNLYNIVKLSWNQDFSSDFS